MYGKRRERSGFGRRAWSVKFEFGAKARPWFRPFFFGLLLSDESIRKLPPQEELVFFLFSFVFLS